jgi:uncharacterized RmlC-like cupin family protein
MTGRVRRLRPNELSEGPATPGMQRREAFVTARMWSGMVHTEPGVFSGWHHHGEHESVIYVVTGGLRMESGVDGADVFDALPGEFIFVPPYCVHREGNMTEEVATIVVIRQGLGDHVFNVDGPPSGVSSRPETTQEGLR